MLLLPYYYFYHHHAPPHYNLSQCNSLRRALDEDLNVMQQRIGVRDGAADTLTWDGWWK